jgi:hypothetical protein
VVTTFLATSAGPHAPQRFFSNRRLIWTAGHVTAGGDSPALGSRLGLGDSETASGPSGGGGPDASAPTAAPGPAGAHPASRAATGGGLPVPSAFRGAETRPFLASDENVRAKTEIHRIIVQ